MYIIGCMIAPSYIIYSRYIYTVESHYNEIAYSECLNIYIVKYFASPSKSCILLYTFNTVNIRYKELILVPFELHYNEIPLYIGMERNCNVLIVPSIDLALPPSN